MQTNYCVLDIETNSVEKYGRTANFMFNNIVAFSVKNRESQYTRYVESQADIEALIEIITKHDVLIAHNAKFECLYLWEHKLLQQWLQQGGKIYCTQLAEYCISNYQNQWAALRDIAVNKYGCKERIKYLELLLFDNPKSEYADVSDLPKDKVLFDVENDVKDTEQIFLRQQSIIEARGPTFKQLITNQMDTLLSTVEMEFNGFCIDEDILTEDQQELEGQLHLCQLKLNRLIEKYWVIHERN